jgi:hypothetical protein
MGDSLTFQFFFEGETLFSKVLDTNEATLLIYIWDLKWHLKTWSFCVFVSYF